MRPNTSASGIFSTKRSRPVSTSMLTRILVPKPKKAFQSPGTQSLGLKVVSAMSFSPVSRPSTDRRQNVRGAGHPAEDAALRLDHLEPHLLELRKVRADAILRHEAVVAAVVGLAHGGIDADFRGDAGHHE